MANYIASTSCASKTINDFEFDQVSLLYRNCVKVQLNAKSIRIEISLKGLSDDINRVVL